jgi:hypothetical protein
MGGCICEQSNEHSPSARKIYAPVYGNLKIFVRVVVAHDANAPAEVRLEALSCEWETRALRQNMPRKNAAHFGGIYL